MNAPQINNALDTVLRELGLPSLPLQVTDRDGRPMDLSGNVWHFNTVNRPTRFDWSGWGLKNPMLAYTMQQYVLRAILRNSAETAFGIAKDLRLYVGGVSFNPTKEEVKKGVTNKVRETWEALQSLTDSEELPDALYGLMSIAVEELRRMKRLYSFYVPRAWFDWCSDRFSELGFSEEHALRLMRIRVPGSPKGEAVRTEDEDGGPMYDLEVTAIRRALADDTSEKREHIMQRAAVALCLAYGRNSSNYTMLREEDFNNMAEGLVDENGEPLDPDYQLRIPRIKKRGVKPRDQFITEYMYPDMAAFIKKLIEANKVIDTGSRPRPLFMRDNPDERRVGTGMDDYAWHLDIIRFGGLIRSFAQRMNIISYRTGEVLRISPRRLRYTFATSMVEQGVSKTALAQMLDHTDIQSVQVYYELKGKRLLKHLDAAAAGKLARIFNFFKGVIVDSPEDAVNGTSPAKQIRWQSKEDPTDISNVGACGETPLCRLDPPYSCYVCTKFQPYRDANHLKVLEELILDRDVRMAKFGSRLGIQLDDVIVAVAEVVLEIHGEAALGEVVLNEDALNEEVA